ncbi:MAG: cbb3-type cytochrome oxidase assembly protein [Burkholderiales bacterium]|nr:cbb3-type cytochrome oxidase assembly protein [Burkholderiales bacterium]
MLGVFAWALESGQFDDLEQHGTQIFEADAESVDRHQAP